MGIFHIFYSCTFLGAKKSTKRRRPLQLGLRLPSRKRFFGAVRNSPTFGGLKQPARFLRKKHSRSAALQRAVSTIYGQLPYFLTGQSL